MAEFIDRIELMRRLQDFGREIPKDQVLEIIARMPEAKIIDLQKRTDEERVGDLISRQTAIRTLTEHFAKKIIEFGYKSYGEADTLEKMYCDGVTDAMNIVDTLPSADRPKGEWIESREQNILMAKRIEKGETWRVCSNCGTGYMIGAQYEGQKSYGERFHNFCPRCGADMRREEKDQCRLKELREKQRNATDDEWNAFFSDLKEATKGDDDE